MAQHEPPLRNTQCKFCTAKPDYYKVGRACHHVLGATCWEYDRKRQTKRERERERDQHRLDGALDKSERGTTPLLHNHLGIAQMAPVHLNLYRTCAEGYICSAA